MCQLCSGVQVSVLTVSVFVAKINFSLLFLLSGVKNIEVHPPPATFSRFQSRSGDQVEGGSEEHQVEQPQQEGQRAQPGEPVLADDVIHLVAFVPWTT